MAYEYEPDMKRRVHNTLEEDFKHLIEAAIVRILKYKKELEVFVGA